MSVVTEVTVKLGVVYEVSPGKYILMSSEKSAPTEPKARKLAEDALKNYNKYPDVYMALETGYKFHD